MTEGRGFVLNDLESKLSDLELQIRTKMTESKQLIERLQLKGDNKLLLSCVLRYYPRTSSFNVKFPMLKNLLPSNCEKAPIIVSIKDC